MEKENNQKIDLKSLFVHIEWVIIMVTLIGGFLMIDNKIDQNNIYANQRIDQVNARTDQLYQMWSDMQKEISDTQKEIKDLYISNKNKG